jgi:DNA-binding transcriptional LysR family regulator
MDFDTARLRAFLQVAERGSVAAAAAHLGYSGPGVSQQLAKLERQLGAPLFARAGGRLRISTSGERLLPTARLIVELADQAATAPLGAGSKLPVSIAACASAIHALVLPLLGSRIAHDFDIVVRDRDDLDALGDLRAGDTDLAIVQEYPGFPIERTRGLVHTALHADRLRLIGPPDMRPTVRLRQLADARWLVNGTGTRCEQVTERLLRDAGIRPTIVGRVTDNETLLALVSAGHGATIVPELVLGGRRRGLTVARVDLGATRTLLAVVRAGSAHGLAPLVDLLVSIGSRLATAER